MSHQQKPELTSMRARKKKLMPQARQLRQEGYTFAEIGYHLGVTQMTAWNYAHDVPQGDIYAEDRK